MPTLAPLAYCNAQHPGEADPISAKVADSLRYFFRQWDFFAILRQRMRLVQSQRKPGVRFVLFFSYEKDSRYPSKIYAAARYAVSR
jgi:hypothetical protein